MRLTQPVCITIPELASQLGTKPETLREYASRKRDPLPIRYIAGKERGGFVLVREFEDWCKRNTVTIGRRRHVTKVS